MRTLTHLLRNPSDARHDVERIYLAHTDLSTDENAKALLAMVKHFTSVSDISLMHTNITPQFMHNLALAIANLPNIKSITLYQSNIDTEGAQILVKALLKKHNHIHHLNLRENRILVDQKCPSDLAKMLLKLNPDQICLYDGSVWVMENTDKKHLQEDIVFHEGVQRTLIAELAEAMTEG